MQLIRNCMSKSSSNCIKVVITCCTKLLEFDWLRRMQLIRNCTGQIQAKLCNCDSIGCFCHAKSCNRYLIGYFCRAKPCNSP